MRVIGSMVKFGALGFILSVLVAWACALTPLAVAGGGYEPPYTVSDWPVPVPVTWPEPREVEGVANAFGKESLVISGSNDAHHLRLTSSGWPLYSMRSVAVAVGTPSTSWWGSTLEVPLQPVPKGLAFNALLYGGVLWMLFAMPSVIRRERVKRQGRCSECGRGVRATHGICPDCT